MNVSYCIPTHDKNPKCQQYLFDIFHALSLQTDMDFNVWVSDHGTSNKVLQACEEYEDLFEINYVRNENARGNISANSNSAMRLADGKILKIIFSDDMILTKNLNAELINAFLDPKVEWAVTGFAHTLDDGKTHYNPKIPVWNNRLLEGVNTLSSPSILAVRNNLGVYFDEELTMLMDCDMFYRLYKDHGKPAVLTHYHVSNREHASQTQRLHEHLLPKEIDYLKKKHYDS